MYQLPATIWNRIAEEQTLKTAWATRLFPLPQTELDAALEAETAKLQTAGTELSVISAFLTLAPLLWELEAVQAFAEDHPQYAAGLTEVQTVTEALAVAEMDRPMGKTEATQLRQLLSQSNPT